MSMDHTPQEIHHEKSLPLKPLLLNTALPQIDVISPIDVAHSVACSSISTTKIENGSDETKFEQFCISSLVSIKLILLGPQDSISLSRHKP